MKEIAKEDAQKIHEEFAEVGADDVLQVIEDPTSEPVVPPPLKAAFTSPQQQKPRKSESSGGNRLPPLRSVPEAPKVNSGKQKMPPIKPNSGNANGKMEGAEDGKNNKLFYKRKKPAEKRASEEVRKPEAVAKQRYPQQLFDRPKTHAQPQTVSHLASTVKSPC